MNWKGDRDGNAGLRQTESLCEVKLQMRQGLEVTSNVWYTKDS